jgi:hypothetical protein
MLGGRQAFANRTTLVYCVVIARHNPLFHERVQATLMDAAGAERVSAYSATSAARQFRDSRDTISLTP